MGTPEFSLASALPAAFFNRDLLANPFAREGLPPPQVPQTATEASGGVRNGAPETTSGDLQEAFDAVAYSSRVERISLSAQFQAIAARFAESEDGSELAELTTQQLEFEFFAETRTEELVAFQQRNEAVANQLEGPRQSQFVAASQSVEARFAFSLSISGEALAGFNNAAEGSVSLDEIFDQLVETTLQLLGQADEAFSEFFSFLSGDNGESLEDTLEGLLQQFQESFLGSSFFGNAGSAEAVGGGSQTTTVQLEFSFEFSAQITVQEGVVQQSDPIILDLDGDGFELTSHRDGARFDILGNGQQANTAFVTGGDAFLAVDRNGNGQIDSGLELFGDQQGAANGYEQLREFDSNGDGVIDRQDDDFDKLLLFRDNGNGITEEGELLTLADAGIESLSLRYAQVDERVSGGNRITQLANFTRTDGSRGRTADAILNFTA